MSDVTGSSVRPKDRSISPIPNIQRPTPSIAPSILAADFGHLVDQIRAVEAAGGIDRLHVDVMDGVFVPNISFGPMLVRVMRRATTLPLDVHLMIVEPGRYLEEFAKSGASALTIHQEASPHLRRDIDEIRRLGCKAGVAINPGTSVSAIDAVLDVVELVLVMSVNPGFGGQQFIPSSVAKVARVRQMLDAADSEAEISVDGGINDRTAPLVVGAGATVLVTGSAIFNHSSGITAGVRAIQDAVKS